MAVQPSFTIQPEPRTASVIDETFSFEAIKKTSTESLAVGLESNSPPMPRSSLMPNMTRSDAKIDETQTSTQSSTILETSLVRHIDTKPITSTKPIPVSMTTIVVPQSESQSSSTQLSTTDIFLAHRSKAVTSQSLMTLENSKFYSKFMHETLSQATETRSTQYAGESEILPTQEMYTSSTQHFMIRQTMMLYVTTAEITSAIQTMDESSTHYFVNSSAIVLKSDILLRSSAVVVVTDSSTQNTEQNLSVNQTPSHTISANVMSAYDMSGTVRPDGMKISSTASIIFPFVMPTSSYGQIHSTPLIHSASSTPNLLNVSQSIMATSVMDMSSYGKINTVSPKLMTSSSMEVLLSISKHFSFPQMTMTTSYHLETSLKTPSTSKRPWISTESRHEQSTSIPDSPPEFTSTTDEMVPVDPSPHYATSPYSQGNLTRQCPTLTSF